MAEFMRIGKKLYRFLAGTVLAAGLAAMSLTGCAWSDGEKKEHASGTEEQKNEHEPITIMDGNRDYSGLIALVREKYPEIRFEIQSYQGYDTSAYMKKQLESGIMPDIYSTTQKWDERWQKAHLIDLAQYKFTDNYNEARMDETEVDGATYLLPYDMDVLSLVYNKSLFERHGWEVPESMAQMRELIPKIREAGVEVSICKLGLPGNAFQYFCNVSDTVFLNTIQGRQWQNDFLAGSVDASALAGCVDAVQEWIDLGIFNTNHGEISERSCEEMFCDGNTAFLVGGISRFSQNEDGSGDQYACMPYLSEDGNSNMYISLTNRYYGLNRELLKPENKQKLEDAVHVLDVMSTIEGYEAILGKDSAVMCSLKEFSLPESSPYHEVMREINSGHSAPLIYNGWNSYIADFGLKIQDWMKGNARKETILPYLNDLQNRVIHESVDHYANAEQEFDTKQSAKLVGMAFTEMARSDGALISINEWKPQVKTGTAQNMAGVNGEILPGVMTEEDIVIILPTGWNQTIREVTLTGAEIQELLATGYDRHGDGDTYPYVLVTRDGKKLEDDRRYTIVICGATDEVLAEGRVWDTRIVGLDAMKAYLRKIETISADLLGDDSTAECGAPES